MIRTGVVGVGHLGSVHARILATLEESQLVGVYDIISERAQAVARQWNVQAFPSLEALLEAVEAVSVVTPTETHYPVARRVLEAGRHLFLEKPMTQHLEEARALVDLARRQGVRFQVGHVERFNPAVLAVRDWVHNPRFIESHRLTLFPGRGTDVDVVLDLMIHDLDLVLYFVGPQEIEFLDAVGVPVLTHKVDIANARLRFKNGCTVNLTASRVYSSHMRKFRIFQRDTYISLDTRKKDVEVYILRDGTVLPYFPEVDRSQEPLALELRAFLQAIQHRQDPPVTGEDGLRALELAHRILDTIHENLKRYEV